MMNTITLALLMLSFESMSPKKLQKICYYAYSWYLTIYRVQLSPANFEAWVHGPVSREIYNAYKGFGWDLIPKYKGFLVVDNETINFAKEIWNVYGKYSADELEKMTHKELPWLNARNGYSKYEPSDIVLDDNDIINYFYEKFQKTNKICI